MFQESITALMQLRGETATLKVRSAQTRSDNGLDKARTFTEYPVRASLRSATERSADGLVTETKRKAFIDAYGLSAAPKKNDLLVTSNGDQYSIVDVDTKMYGAEVLAYILDVQGVT